MVHSILINSF